MFQELRSLVNGDSTDACRVFRYEANLTVGGRADCLFRILWCEGPHDKASEVSQVSTAEARWRSAVGLTAIRSPDPCQVRLAFDSMPISQRKAPCLALLSPKVSKGELCQYETKWDSCSGSSTLSSERHPDITWPPYWTDFLHIACRCPPIR
jgi:hypothetical protein